ncbi:TonB-dependent receptor [Rapidithrix thailandica]|uniref:TonB-dependent receptor n=1 Tax=Rapidithrix thailandica TaxID=413964 RepID=A0AAW9SKK1_9BACT
MLHRFLMSILGTFTYYAFFTLASYAQSPLAKLEGKVLYFKEPIEFAHVALYALDNDSLPLTLTTTDPSGFYTLSVNEGGEYLLKVSFIGYQPHTKNVQLQAGTTTTENIALETDSEFLESVEVVGEKASVTYLLDKKVVTFDEKILAGTSSAADALVKVPEINIDAKGNVKIRGNSGVTVLINGKPSMLSPADLIGNMSSASISQVEIITTPSAKYDPDGAGGIINIITQQQQDVNISGKATVGAGLDEKYNASLKLDLTKGRWHHFFTASLRHEDNPATKQRDFLKKGETDYTTFSEEEELAKFGMVQLGTEFKMDSSNLVYLSYQHSNLDENTPVRFRNIDAEAALSETGKGDLDFGMLENKFQAGYVFSGKNSHLSADVLYSLGKLRVNSESESRKEGNHNNAYYTSSLKNESDFYFFDYTIDYSLTLGKSLKMELGHAGEYVNTENNYSAIFQETHSGIKYDYKESIQALFTLFTFKKGNYTFQGGLRFENVLQEVSTMPADPYQNLYPSLGIEYKLSGQKSLSFNYSRRISRPDPFQFIPLERQVNSRETEYGNPELQPAYSNNLELGYKLFNDKIGVKSTVYFILINDLINRVLLQEENLSKVTFENIDQAATFGVSLSAETELNQWYSLDGSIEVLNYRLKDDTFTELNDDYTYAILKLNQVVSFGHGLNLQLNGSYTSNHYEALRELRSSYQLGATVEKSLFNKHANLSFSVRRFVYSGERSTRYSGLYQIKEEYIPQNPIFRLSFTYSFSKN